MDSVFEAAHDILASSTIAGEYMDADVMWGRLQELGFDAEYYDDFLAALKRMKLLVIFPDGEMFLSAGPWTCRNRWRIVHGE